MRPHTRFAGSLAAVCTGAVFAMMATDIAQQPPPIAIVGATIIDGNGGEPLRDATLIVTGDRITAVGSRASIAVPKGATVIDAAGKFVTPGFTDTNVHISLYGGGTKDRKETSVRYQT